MTGDNVENVLQTARMLVRSKNIAAAIRVLINDDADTMSPESEHLVVEGLPWLQRLYDFTATQNVLETTLKKFDEICCVLQKNPENAQFILHFLTTVLFKFLEAKPSSACYSKQYLNYLGSLLSAETRKVSSKKRKRNSTPKREAPTGNIALDVELTEDDGSFSVQILEVEGCLTYNRKPLVVILKKYLFGVIREGTCTIYVQDCDGMVSLVNTYKELTLEKGWFISMAISYNEDKGSFAPLMLYFKTMRGKALISKEHVGACYILHRGLSDPNRYFANMILKYARIFCLGPLTDKRLEEVKMLMEACYKLLKS